MKTEFLMTRDKRFIEFSRFVYLETIRAPQSAKTLEIVFSLENQFVTKASANKHHITVLEAASNRAWRRDAIYSLRRSRGYCLFLIILSMLDHEQSIMFGEVLRASKKTLMGAHRLSLGVRIFMLITPRVPRGVHTSIFFYSRHGLRQKEGLLIVYFYSRVNDKTARHTAPHTQHILHRYTCIFISLPLLTSWLNLACCIDAGKERKLERVLLW